jgi:hypothetical protein
MIGTKRWQVNQRNTYLYKNIELDNIRRILMHLIQKRYSEVQLKTSVKRSKGVSNASVRRSSRG